MTIAARTSNGPTSMGSPARVDSACHGGAPRQVLKERRRAERDSLLPGREADPFDERRRIHFAAAEDASGGSGGCAASTPQLNDERSAIRSPRGREADPHNERRRIHFAAAEDASGGSGGCAASTPSSRRSEGSQGEAVGRPRFQ